jgi:preprotein translocase subunit SecA
MRRQRWLANPEAQCVGAYPERSLPEPGAFDRALLSAFARLSSRFEQGAERLAPMVADVEACGLRLAALSEGPLREVSSELRVALVRHGFRADLVARTFALVREVSHRLLGLRHYPVQIMGGWTLIRGMLAEMETGEGKTITAALPAATAALAGIPVHVVTVNDYLAARDAELLEPVYRFLGLTVGVVQHGQEPSGRRAAYACDVTYAVNKEIAFDYLRDKLTLGARSMRSNIMVDRLGSASAGSQLLLRGLRFAVVDEADSVLVDEARTPLIISGAAAEDDTAEVYALALSIAARLEPDHDFELVKNEQAAQLTPAGSARLAIETGGFGGLWQARRAREELVENALSARHLFTRGKHYAVIDGAVQIVDEHTGRISEGRAWQHGLHQMIEVKEGCALTSCRETLASITYQRFFRRYQHLCGMSGTLAEVAGELRAVYGVKTLRIPTNRPSRRSNLGVKLHRSRTQKWQAVIAAAHAQMNCGRPVLVETRSIRDSEELSGLLSNVGLEHVVLNAHHDKREAEIIAQAGQQGRITVATNMAGRGTDIILGDGVAPRGGLHVILTEFHDARRIDRQLIGRGGRQGDPGSFEAIVSLEDDIFTRFAARASGIAHRLMPALSPAWGSLAQLLRRHAQGAAERAHLHMRREVLRSQRQLDKALAFSGRQ